MMWPKLFLILGMMFECCYWSTLFDYIKWYHDPNWLESPWKTNNNFLSIQFFLNILFFALLFNLFYRGKSSIFVLKIIIYLFADKPEIKQTIKKIIKRTNQVRIQNSTQVMISRQKIGDWIFHFQNKIFSLRWTRERLHSQTTVDMYYV